MKRISQLRWSVFIACACTTAVPNSVRASDRADEILARYGNAVSALSSIRFEGTKYTYEQGGPFESETWIDAEEVTYVSDRGQWRFRLRQRGNSWYGGTWMPFAVDVEHARNERGDLYEVHREYEPPQVLQEQDALDLDIPTEGGPTVMVTLEDSSAGAGTASQRQEIARPIFGFLPFDHDHWLPDLMRDAGVELTEEPEPVGDDPAIVLKSTGPFGEHVLWLDADRGYLPRRIRCVKEGNARFGPGEEPMATLKAHGNPKHRKPNSPLRKCVYEVRNISLTTVDQRTVIDGFETLTTFQYQNGATFRQREVIALHELSLHPEPAELALTMPIDDGTRVHITNAPAISSEWKDGQIVKVWDQSTINSLADVQFQSNSGMANRWLIMINVGLVVGFVGFLVWRRLNGVGNNTRGGK